MLAYSEFQPRSISMGVPLFHSVNPCLDTRQIDALDARRGHREAELPCDSILSSRALEWIFSQQMEHGRAY